MSTYNIELQLNVPETVANICKYKDLQAARGLKVTGMMLNEKLAAHLVDAANIGPHIKLIKQRSGELSCFVDGIKLIPTDKLDGKHPLFILENNREDYPDERLCRPDYFMDD